MTIDLKNLTITKARNALDRGEFTAVDLTRGYLDRIEELNPEINAYLEVFDDALDQAKKADKVIKEGKATALTGIPISVKDNILIKGKRSTSASKILEGHVATYDATVIERLKEHHPVFLGRTNMDEFAMGASTETSAYGVTRNPHDPERVPGGSSGGAAAALAADMCLVSLGSDTAGSIRQPSAFCGLTGLKPTYGGVSRSGLMALGSSLDCIGPLTKTVEDAEIVWNIIRGQDSLDMTTIPEGIYEKNTKNKKDFVIGIPTFVSETEGIDDIIRSNYEESIAKLEKLGYKTKEVKLHNIKYSVPTYYVILPAEASSNLARVDGVKYGYHSKGKDLLDTYKKTRGEGFGKEVRRRIILGTYVLSAGYYDAYYNKAQAVRKLITEDFDKAFGDVDLIALPTTASPAFKLGEKTDDPVQMYLEDIFTVPANHAGLPAMTVPSGTTTVEGKELPLGFQLYAPRMQEHLLFEVGKDFEKSR